MGWHFYNYAFHFNKRLRQTDRFKKAGIRKNQDASPASCIKPCLKPPLRMRGMATDMAWENAGPYHKDIWLFCPCLLEVSFRKDWWLNSVWWVILEQENALKLHLGLLLLSSSLGSWRELCEKAKKAKSKRWPIHWPICKIPLYCVFLLLILSQSNLLIFQGINAMYK